MKDLGILIIDMQEKFLVARVSESIRLIENHLKLIESAKEKDIPLFVMEYIDDGKTIRELRKPLERLNASFIKKYNDNAFIKLKNIRGEYIFDANKNALLKYFTDSKEIYSKYMKDSELDSILKERKIKNLIITGVNKSGCVLRTSMEAKKERGYNLITSKELLNEREDCDEQVEDWYKNNTSYFESLNELLSLI